MQSTTVAMQPGPLVRTIAPDPLAEARELLHRAARLPYEASRCRGWGPRFLAYAEQARRAVIDHVLGAERTDSAIERMRRMQPRLASRIQRQAREHQALLVRIHGLVLEAGLLTMPDVWAVVRLSEEALLIERDLGRHQDRLLDLVHEVTQVELGGEG
jgi:hypothetical protein